MFIYAIFYIHKYVPVCFLLGEQPEIECTEIYNLVSLLSPNLWIHVYAYKYIPWTGGERFLSFFSSPCWWQAGATVWCWFLFLPWCVVGHVRTDWMFSASNLESKLTLSEFCWVRLTDKQSKGKIYTIYFYSTLFNSIPCNVYLREKVRNSDFYSFSLFFLVSVFRFSLIVHI